MKTKLLTHGLAFIAMCMMAIAPMKAEETKAALVVCIIRKTKRFSFPERTA